MTEENLQFDVAVIGGGVIGCSIAWRLARSGQRVALIDRGEIGQEASWAAGGMLAPLAEADNVDDFFKLAVASCAMYADLAQELAGLTGIDIAYRTEGILYLAFNDEDESHLEGRWQWQHRAGLNVEKLSAGDVLKLEPEVNPALRWALRFPDDHQVDARKLIAALKLAAELAGVFFLTRTEVRKILTTGNQVKGLETSSHKIFARQVIIAAGSWSKFLQPKIQVEPVRGQMVALRFPEARLQHVIYSERGYLIPRSEGIVIAGSTTEQVGYEKAVTAKGLYQILNNALEILPSLENFQVLETWSGLRPRATDEWPILGRDPHLEGLTYATGHYRNGILLMPLTAKAITEEVLFGKSTINLDPFRLARLTPQATSA